DPPLALTTVHRRDLVGGLIHEYQLAARPSFCTYMEGAVASSGCGGRVSVLGRCGVEIRAQTISARAVAAREVWWGFSRRLIPQPGQFGLPGALGARRKLSPIVWALMVGASGAGGFRLLGLRAGRGSCGGRSCGRRSVERGHGRSARRCWRRG